MKIKQFSLDLQILRNIQTWEVQKYKSDLTFWEPALMKTLSNQTCILNSVHKFLRTQAILSGLFLLYAVHIRTWIYDICSNDFFFLKQKAYQLLVHD